MSIFRKKSITKALVESQENSENDSGGLVKNLTVTDLTFLGIAAILGASIFSAIGKATGDGGPAVSLLFVFTSFACMLTAYCYARFASVVPISGSAYTYAYVSLGEGIAWILGWNLLLEYAISNIAVAIAWSEYFTTLLRGFGIILPEYITMDYLTASRNMDEACHFLQTNTLENLPNHLRRGYIAWQNAPEVFNFKLIANVPALAITILITSLIYTGIKESKRVNNLLVILKLLVMALVIGAGAFYIKPENWVPFAPNGVSGVMKSVAAVCFAYIGFDAVSTTAEECKNPQRDIPRSMMYALGICTVIYVLVTLVLTGMVKYNLLGTVADPLAFAFEKLNLNFISGVIAASAVIALSSALLAYQLGQPRIWFAMSRDGLLPKAFSTIHPKYKTPSFSTIVTGFVVGIPSLFMNLTEVIELSSIGTLFAFILVCIGVLYLENNSKNVQKNQFKIPFISGKYIVGGSFLVALLTLFYFDFDWKMPVAELILLALFLSVWFLMSILSYVKNLSLIPVAGLLFNVYLMVKIGPGNWTRFGIWCLIGILIYFAYGYHKSKLNDLNKN